MKIIGITGGIGCGKSTILELLQKNFNACVIKTDDLGRKVLEPGTEGYLQVVNLFGEDILDSHGMINRSMLAEIVFHDEEMLCLLNDIVHPLVKMEVCHDIARAKEQGRYDFYFIESALIFEDHYELLCDEVWYITAELSVRVERLMKSRGYSEEKILSIMAQQLSDEEFSNRCDFVLNNSTTLEYALEQLKKRLDTK